MNIEDTSIIQDMKSVQKLVEEILRENVSNDKAHERKTMNDVDGPEADDTSSDPKVADDTFDDIKPPDEGDNKKSKFESKPAPKPRKTELEKLHIDNEKFVPKDGKRLRKATLFERYNSLDNSATTLDYFTTVNTFANSIKAESTKDYNVMSVTTSSSTVTWPVYIRNAEEIGQTTTALMCGVTEVLARQHVRQAGQVGGETVGGSRGSEIGDHTVYLI